MLLPRIRPIFLVLLLAACLLWRGWLPLFIQFSLLLRMPLRWKSASAASLISLDRDHFDLTFASESHNHSGPAPPIPRKLHHIHLGASSPRPEWEAARADCLKHHADWDTYLWDEAAAGQFVHDHYPHLLEMWQSYPYPVQRVDALRYMILYHHGGVVLDFDLACKRSLEPLRQFDFVAPEAHPAGFSIGMLLASPQNPFIGELVRTLPAFNRRWLWMPYVTVMFSTGCHYASTIFTVQSDRSRLRILSGTASHPTMHMLNGRVDTPLFRHLGSSSWHDRDAAFIQLLKNLDERTLFAAVTAILLLATSMAALIALAWVCHAHRRARERALAASPAMKSSVKSV